MKILLKNKYLVLAVSFCFVFQAYSVPRLNRNKALNKTTYAKIATVQALKCIYLVSIASYGYGVISSVNQSDSFNSQDVTLKQAFYDFIVRPVVLLGSAYSSWYSFRALSGYINKVKGIKSNAVDVKYISTQSNYDDNEEDIEKSIVDILFHLGIVFSCYKRIKEETQPFKYAIKVSIPFLNKLFFNDTRTLNDNDKQALKINLMPVCFLAPAKLYTAYHSLKIINSKIRTIMMSYKTELPKYSLGNSVQSSEKQII